jgi:hypothetical protein
VKSIAFSIVATALLALPSLTSGATCTAGPAGQCTIVCPATQGCIAGWGAPNGPCFKRCIPPGTGVGGISLTPAPQPGVGGAPRGGGGSILAPALGKTCTYKDPELKGGARKADAEEYCRTQLACSNVVCSAGAGQTWTCKCA